MFSVAGNFSHSLGAAPVPKRAAGKSMRIKEYKRPLKTSKAEIVQRRARALQQSLKIWVSGSERDYSKRSEEQRGFSFVYNMKVHSLGEGTWSTADRSGVNHGWLS